MQCVEIYLKAKYKHHSIFRVCKLSDLSAVFGENVHKLSTAVYLQITVLPCKTIYLFEIYIDNSFKIMFPSPSCSIGLSSALSTPSKTFAVQAAVSCLVNQEMDKTKSSKAL